MTGLHYWTTSNDHKMTILLEETGLPYRLVPANISAGDQFNPESLAIAPNNRIPAIVDTPADNPVSAGVTRMLDAYGGVAGAATR